MARRARLKISNDQAIYHVMSRTAQQSWLFEDPKVREWIYQKIVWLAKVYYIDLYSVTVLSNHYHIVLAVRKPEKNELDLQHRFELFQSSLKFPNIWREWLLDPWYDKVTNLSEYMKELNQIIARHLNRVNQTHGHVWGDRFKSVLIEDGRGLLTCLAYVELNCVRAKLAQKPSDYRFCSAGRHDQGGREAAGVTFPSLGMFEGLRSKAQHQKAFYMFVDHLALREQGLPDNNYTCDLEKLQEIIESQSIGNILDLVFRRTKWMVNSVILGSDAFCTEKIRELKLQFNSLKEPVPFRIAKQVYNSHQREGPFLA